MRSTLPQKHLVDWIQNQCQCQKHQRQGIGVAGAVADVDAERNRQWLVRQRKKKRQDDVDDVVVDAQFRTREKLLDRLAGVGCCWWNTVQKLGLSGLWPPLKKAQQRRLGSVQRGPTTRRWRYRPWNGAAVVLFALKPCCDLQTSCHGER